MTEYDLSAMRDALPRQAAEILAEMGIAQADFSGLFQTSFSDVLRAVTGVVRGAMREPVAFFSAGCGLLLLLGLFSAAGKPDGKPSGFVCGRAQCARASAAQRCLLALS